MSRTCRATQGAESNDKKPAVDAHVGWVGRGSPEPVDHGLGRSRGGWTSKLHLICDGRGRALSIGLTGGNVNDTTMLGAALAEIRVARPGPGRPRTTPDQMLGDKGYSSKANRALLAERGIVVTIPERADQLANRVRRGSTGGRPYAFDKDAYKGRNVVERAFNRLKQWRGIATRYDKKAVNYRGGIVFASMIIWLTT
ncbi:IS5 family transposase [Modestobacter sp. DSM 44400]|uniref:IS5 family transposase n=1 Tax=Modestobacter sp. DSM 44400 TaxID=1550230 RepID=UPI002110E18C|nr:IS5 family transposase [Modestobacter sp. DSM 44400]